MSDTKRKVAHADPLPMTSIGELSDEAIDAIAELLIEKAEQEVMEAGDE